MVLNNSAHDSTQLVVRGERDPVIEATVLSREEPQGGMSLAQIVTIARAYWRISLLIAVSIVTLTAVVTKLMPKTYSGVATMMISSDVNDPLGGKEFANVMAAGGYISTQIELMQSPEVLDPVIERLNLVADPNYASGNRGGEATLRDWVETKLRKNLDIQQGRAGSQLIYVTATATSAQLAADLANAVADIYVEQQYKRMNGPASERALRYSEELADLKRKVAAAQDAVTQFRHRTGTLDLDAAKGDVDMDMLAALEQRLLEAKNGLTSNQAHATASQENSARALGSNLVMNLREEGASLRSKMAKLRSTLGPNHPQVIELQSQIDANTASLNAALSNLSNATTSDITVSRSEVAQLEKAVEAQRQKVLQGRQFHDEGAKYQLELESAQAVYKRALDGFDQIMFASTGHTTNVSMASRARPPVKADKPNAIKNMLLGVVLGLGLGLAAPFVYELLHRRVRCRDDVERDFGIPILTEFDAVLPRAAATG